MTTACTAGLLSLSGLLTLGSYGSATSHTAAPAMGVPTSPTAADMPTDLRGLTLDRSLKYSSPRMVDAVLETAASKKLKVMRAWGFLDIGKSGGSDSVDGAMARSPAEHRCTCLGAPMLTTQFKATDGGVLISQLNASDETQTARVASALLNIGVAWYCDLFGVNEEALARSGGAVTLEVLPRRAITPHLELTQTCREVSS